MRPDSMRERRIDTRPHYKQSAERDHSFLIVITFVVGAMLGATIALGVVL